MINGLTLGPSAGKLQQSNRELAILNAIAAQRGLISL